MNFRLLIIPPASHTRRRFGRGNYQFLYYRRRAGQGLMETVLGVMVVLITVAVFTGLISRLLSVTGTANKEAQATRLANLRMELIRATRDTQSWGNFNAGCYIVYGGEIEWANNPPCNFTEIEEDSKFKEKIVVSDSDSDTKKVEVSVQYRQELGSKDVELVSYLTNWRIR